jgi:hypothetical protein
LGFTKRELKASELEEANQRVTSAEVVANVEERKGGYAQ